MEPQASTHIPCFNPPIDKSVPCRCVQHFFVLVPARSHRGRISKSPVIIKNRYYIHGQVADMTQMVSCRKDRDETPP